MTNKKQINLQAKIYRKEFFTKLKNNNLTIDKNKYFFKNDFLTLFNINKKIDFITLDKPLKPALLKELHNKYNHCILYITYLNEKGKDQEYSFLYNGKIKNIKIFESTHYTNQSECYYRNEANKTVLICQDKKYIDENINKKETRKNYDIKNDNNRLIWCKDFYNNYGEEENRQRFKYCYNGFDPAKSSSIYINNLVLKNRYSFNNYHTGYYYKNNKNIEIDKSGYILSYKRDELKRKAQEISKNKLLENFKTYKKDNYILTLNNIINNINDSILKLYNKAVTNIENIKVLNNLLNKRIYSYINDLEEYIKKLNSNEFIDILYLDNEINKLIDKSNNYIDNTIKEFNIYLNFVELNKIIEFEKDYFEYRNYFEKNGFKYVCCEKNYYENKHFIENNKLYLLDYDITIKNYFAFI